MEKMGKEQTVAQFEAIFWSLYGETEKHLKMSEHYLSRLIFKHVRPEHKSNIVCAIVLALLQNFIQIASLAYHL